MKEYLGKEKLIMLDIDSYDAFDYSSQGTGKYSVQQLKDMLCKEIDKYYNWMELLLYIFC